VFISNFLGIKNIDLSTFNFHLALDLCYRPNRGVALSTALSYSNGTGRFWMLGLGYKFVKPKRK
jgi:hypothetical protein